VSQERYKVGQKRASSHSYVMYSGFNQLRTADHGTGWSRNSIRRMSIWASLGSRLHVKRRTGHHKLLVMRRQHDTFMAGRTAQWHSMSLAGCTVWLAS